MTTAVSNAAQGRAWAAISAQPFGAMLALAAGVMVVGGIHSAVNGSSPMRLLPIRRGGRWLLAIALLFGLAWLYKFLTW